MFQSESEDMTPRCAPKPSVSVLDAATFQPSVPEVSIMFAQTEFLQSKESPKSSTSYAVWKKQCLPNIIYASSENYHFEMPYKLLPSNVFPLRTTDNIISDANARLLVNEDCDSVHYEIDTNPHGGECNPTYRTNECQTSFNSSSLKISEVILPKICEKACNLKVCAGTQTDRFPDAVSHENQSSFLDLKADIAQLKSLLDEMQIQQRILIDFIQHLLPEKRNDDIEEISESKDVSTQYERQHYSGRISYKRPNTKHNSIEMTNQETCCYYQKTDLVPEEASGIQENQTQSPQKVRSALVSGFPRPSTEQSMVMNDLALKYLPNEKLEDLLQGLHVSTVDTTIHNGYELPLITRENSSKNPIDLSTASYKYLKKYRLMSEENNNLASSEDNLLDLETIRRQPKLM